METPDQHAVPVEGPIRIAREVDGALTYLIDVAPENLPPVRKRDVETAWEAARSAARARLWGQARGFRFRRPDGAYSDLLLVEPNAACWANAVDRTMGLGNTYGLSLCLRLLALVDLLAHARWADKLYSLERGTAVLDPALLRLAATARLTAEASFDAAEFYARLAEAGLDQPAPRARLTGASA